MPKIPGINHTRAIKALEKADFKVVRQGKKHIVMSDGARFITLFQGWFDYSRIRDRTDIWQNSEQRDWLCLKTNPLRFSRRIIGITHCYERRYQQSNQNVFLRFITGITICIY